MYSVDNTFCTSDSKMCFSVDNYSLRLLEFCCARCSSFLSFPYAVNEVTGDRIYHIYCCWIATLGVCWWFRVQYVFLLWFLWNMFVLTHSRAYRKSNTILIVLFVFYLCGYWILHLEINYTINRSSKNSKCLFTVETKNHLSRYISY